MADGGANDLIGLARDKRVGPQVLAVIQKAKEDKVLADSNHEINYLQRRVDCSFD